MKLIEDILITYYRYERLIVFVGAFALVGLEFAKLNFAFWIELIIAFLTLFFLIGFYSLFSLPEIVEYVKQYVTTYYMYREGEYRDFTIMKYTPVVSEFMGVIFWIEKKGIARKTRIQDRELRAIERKQNKVNKKNEIRKDTV